MRCMPRSKRCCRRPRPSLRSAAATGSLGCCHALMTALPKERGSAHLAAIVSSCKLCPAGEPTKGPSSLHIRCFLRRRAELHATHATLLAGIESRGPVPHGGAVRRHCLGLARTGPAGGAIPEHAACPCAVPVDAVSGVSTDTKSSRHAAVCAAGGFGRQHASRGAVGSVSANVAHETRPVAGQRGGGFRRACGPELRSANC